MSEQHPSLSELILYQTEDGKTRLEVRVDQKTGPQWNWEIKTLRT